MSALPITRARGPCGLSPPRPRRRYPAGKIHTSPSSAALRQTSARQSAIPSEEHTRAAAFFGPQLVFTRIRRHRAELDSLLLGLLTELGDVRAVSISPLCDSSGSAGALLVERHVHTAPVVTADMADGAVESRPDLRTEAVLRVDVGAYIPYRACVRDRRRVNVGVIGSSRAPSVGDRRTVGTRPTPRNADPPSSSTRSYRSQAPRGLRR